MVGDDDEAHDSSGHWRLEKHKMTLNKFGKRRINLGFFSLLD